VAAGWRCRLTGRKIIVDTYGGMPHGGVPSAAKMHLETAPLMRRAGRQERGCRRSLRDPGGLCHRRVPLSVNVETFGTGKIADEKISQLILEHFDLRPGAIIRDLDLRRPIYRQVAAYGHAGAMTWTCLGED
jgi:S-adenosylmethionine synthetase